MRALFVYPNINTQIGFNYGISYISGLLKAHGMETRLINVNEKLGYPLNLDRIRDDVLSYKPDLVGFSVLTNQAKYASTIARHMRGYCDVPIIFGGIHPTMDPHATLADDAIDAICMGEGEEAFLELIGRKGAPEGIRNFGYRQAGGVVLEPLRPFVDITKLPFKDYDIFDFQRMIDAKDGWVGLTASRGCPFRCTYCLNHKIMSLYKTHGHLPKTYLRRHTVDQMISEIDYLLGNYRNIKMFIFDDDIFTFDREWLHEFSLRYRKLTKIGFVCNAHAKVFDEDMARDLKEAGCRIVKFGIESGSDRVRKDILHRYMTNDDIARAFEAAHRFGLHTSAFVMMGLPHETRHDLMETMRLLARVRPGRVRWTLFFPFVGTKAFDIARNAGIIDMEKMHRLDNFTDETCMQLGADEDLLVQKLKRFFCLYMNGLADMDGSGSYGALLDRLECQDLEGLAKNEDTLLEQMRLLDGMMEQRGELYYEVKYNPFMGVRSDWKDDSLSA
jgi:anaerobic magnesium-protoporphyrin IX monomethyl ester cyclase